MKKLLCFAMPLFAAATLLGSAAPAQAHPDACVVQFTLTTSNGLGPPGLTNNTANFTLSSTGVCASGVSFRASGTFTGACGLGVGQGMTFDGHRFTFQVSGNAAVFNGGVNGTTTLVEDPLDSGTCVNATATNFTGTGALILI